MMVRGPQRTGHVGVWSALFKQMSSAIYIITPTYVRKDFTTFWGWKESERK
jgi:hypothetical protein